MSQINIPSILRIVNSNKEVAEELIAFIQEEGFKNIALITTKTPNHLITNELEIALFDHVEKLKTFQVVNASIAYVNQLVLDDFDVVIGIGGGKAIDTAKYAAHVNNLPCISIPTAISNDGICSPVAVLQEKQNKHKSLGATMPIALIVPLHLIRNSHEESILSGVGDLLSNLSSVEDWILAGRETNEYIDDYAVMVAKNAASSVFVEVENCILKHKTKKQFLYDNLKTIIESLALSGIAMEIAGTSRPASGSEHLISHAIDELFGGVKPHGIQVAFGTYITTFLRVEMGYEKKDTFEKLKAVYKFLELPTKPSDIGLTKEQLIEAIIHAPETRAGKYTILNKIKLERDYVGNILDKLFEFKVAISF